MRKNIGGDAKHLFRADAGSLVDILEKVRSEEAIFHIGRLTVVINENLSANVMQKITSQAKRYADKYMKPPLHHQPPIRLVVNNE